MTHAPKTLIITAISAKNGASTIECWKLAAPFVVSSQAGVTGAAFAQLGSTGNTSYAVIPAKYDGGYIMDLKPSKYTTLEAQLQSLGGTL